MSEIKLNRRYPDSKPEDITDAYMRGFEVGLAMRTDENAELREEFDKMDKWHSAELIAAMKENAELRELMRVVITYCINGYCGKDDGCPLRLTDYDCQLLTKASELGVEV